MQQSSQFQNENLKDFNKQAVQITAFGVILEQCEEEWYGRSDTVGHPQDTVSIIDFQSGTHGSESHFIYEKPE